jgi:hypothetical protein
MRASLNVSNDTDFLTSILPSLEEDYSVYLLSFQMIDVHSSRISAPRIGLCSQDINLEQASALSASGLGC